MAPACKSGSRQRKAATAKAAASSVPTAMSQPGCGQASPKAANITTLASRAIDVPAR